MKRNIAARALAEQVETNRTGVGHADSFAGHRERMTGEIVLRAPRGAQGPNGRLCLLGAGNGNDVDLVALAGAFAEVHLVDVDREAVARARERVPVALRDRVRLHAPVEVSGSWDFLETWSRRSAPAETLGAEVAPAVARVLSALPGPFDVVVSCCMLTQLQLVLLDVVDDRHPAFDALRTLTNAIHVRVLAGLTAPGGRALLFTDLTSDATYPFDSLPPDADLGRVMSDLVAAGNVIHAAHPGLLSAEVRRDPELAAAYDVRFPVGPWLWRNGPERIFLVYGLEISRRAAPSPQPSSSQSSSSQSSSSNPSETPRIVSAGNVAARDKKSPTAAGGGPAVSTDPKVIEIDDVIPKLYQDQIENTANGLPWYFHPESARPDLNFTSSYSGFFHLAYDGASASPVVSAINAILVPVLFIFCERVGVPFQALARVRLGLFTKSSLDVPHHNPHVDFYEPHKVALYYVNDSDGDTVIFKERSSEVSLPQSAALANGNKFTEARRIAPKRGRMVFFDGQQYHASMHPRAHPSRIVVTFNFT